MDLKKFIKELFTNSTCKRIIIAAPTRSVLFAFHTKLDNYFEECDLNYKHKGKGGCRLVNNTCTIEFMAKHELETTRGIDCRTVFIILSYENIYYPYFKRVILPIIDSDQIFCHFDNDGRPVNNDTYAAIFKDFATEDNMLKILGFFNSTTTSASSSPSQPPVDSRPLPIHEILKQIS